MYVPLCAEHFDGPQPGWLKQDGEDCVLCDPPISAPVITVARTDRPLPVPTIRGWITVYDEDGRTTDRFAFDGEAERDSYLASIARMATAPGPDVRARVLWRTYDPDRQRWGSAQSEFPIGG
jgi:hypothetical protein